MTATTMSPTTTPPTTTATSPTTGTPPTTLSAPPTTGPGDEEGSLVTEYGLLAIVAATVAAGVIQWASDGALVTLFNALLREARAIVGA